MTDYQNYLFGATFKIVTDQKALLSSLSEAKNSKTTQTRLARCVDCLLPFGYEIEQITGKKMRIIDYLSRHPDGYAPIVSKLGIFCCCAN